MTLFGCNVTKLLRELEDEALVFIVLRGWQFKHVSLKK